MRRSIRLKEWGINQRLVKTPEKLYSALRDDCPIDEYIINTNEQGFILSGNGFNIQDKHPAFIFLGDSFIESMFVHEQHRFHSSLERKLWNSGNEYICYNAGYSGATSLHLINILLNKVIPYRPELVFYALPSNDAFALENNAGVWGKSRVISPLVPHETGFTDLNYGLKDLRSLIKSAHEILTSFGIKVVFMTFPHRFNSYTGPIIREKFKTETKFNKVVKTRRAANETLRRYCIRRNAPLIDLEQMINPFEEFSQDDLHLNPLGSEKLAHIIYSWCNNEFIC